MSFTNAGKEVPMSIDFADPTALRRFVRERVRVRAPLLPRLETSWIVAATFFPVALLLAIVALQPWVPIAYLVRDPLAVAEVAPNCCKVYFGMVSNLGILLWVAAASTCLFAGAVLVAAGETGRRAQFLITAGLFTGWLALDDLFLVHENVLPAFGVPQLLTYAVYAGLGLAYLALAWRQIIESRYLLFVLGGGFLAASVGLDAVVHSEQPLSIFTEDALKLLGIAFWAAFHITASFEQVLTTAEG